MTYAFIAAISGPTPRMLARRVRLSASTCSATTAATTSVAQVQGLRRILNDGVSRRLVSGGWGADRLTVSERYESAVEADLVADGPAAPEGGVERTP